MLRICNRKDNGTNQKKYFHPNYFSSNIINPKSYYKKCPLNLLEFKGQIEVVKGNYITIVTRTSLSLEIRKPHLIIADPLLELWVDF